MSEIPRIALDTEAKRTAFRFLLELEEAAAAAATPTNPQET